MLLLYCIACGGLSGKQRKAVDEALTELRKLDAATDVGVSKMEYSKMLISAQAASNNAIEVLPDGELKNEIRESMQGYVDAKTFWNIMKDDDSFFACETQPPPDADNINQRLTDLLCNPEGGELVRKYKIPLREFKTGQLSTTGKGAVSKKEGMSRIWQSTKEHVQRASSLSQ